ncbi:uncharacterized protein G2W53_016609 [Senna tora]|uniref:Uncharacterized protein n=1 Tax=Senna tora TaxID=362788 RepID=A0A834TRY3_9FABA|nr:uncharacterized protein G2W53_016609 [Senna tora]
MGLPLVARFSVRLLYGIRAIPVIQDFRKYPLFGLKKFCDGLNRNTIKREGG